ADGKDKPLAPKAPALAEDLDFAEAPAAEPIMAGETVAKIEKEAEREFLSPTEFDRPEVSAGFTSERTIAAAAVPTTPTVRSDFGFDSTLQPDGRLTGMRSGNGAITDERIDGIITSSDGKPISTTTELGELSNQLYAGVDEQSGSEPAATRSRGRGTFGRASGSIPVPPARSQISKGLQFSGPGEDGDGDGDGDGVPGSFDDHGKEMAGIINVSTTT
ncbi:MAG: hypothetical protein GY953_37405, partial [bacterium]|nr:hypothetical protein [bacterium]